MLSGCLDSPPLFFGRLFACFLWVVPCPSLFEFQGANLNFPDSLAHCLLVRFSQWESLTRNEGWAEEVRVFFFFLSSLGRHLPGAVIPLGLRLLSGICALWLSLHQAALGKPLAPFVWSCLQGSSSHRIAMGPSTASLVDNSSLF